MKLWERQPSETPKAFAAFGLYLDIPPPRPFSPVGC